MDKLYSVELDPDDLIDRLMGIIKEQTAENKRLNALLLQAGEVIEEHKKLDDSFSEVGLRLQRENERLLAIVKFYAESCAGEIMEDGGERAERFMRCNPNKDSDGCLPSGFIAHEGNIKLGDVYTAQNMVLLDDLPEHKLKAVCGHCRKELKKFVDECGCSTKT